MYGDPSRVSAGALEGYIEGLHVPGTIDHVLQIVERWFVDMGLLRSALTGLASKPTLLIWGDRDRAVGLVSGRELQRTLPHSSLMVLPGVGHIPFEEMPDVCNKAMARMAATSAAVVARLHGKPPQRGSCLHQPARRPDHFPCGPRRRLISPQI